MLRAALKTLGVMLIFALSGCDEDLGIEEKLFYCQSDGDCLEDTPWCVSTSLDPHVMVCVEGPTPLDWRPPRGCDTICDGECTNVGLDVNNCARCGTRCGPGQVCAGGRCVCGTSTGCPIGNVCAGYGNTAAAEEPWCAPAEPEFVCEGEGMMACAPPTEEGGEPDCRNVWRDPDNCGKCGRVCGAGEVCISGVCMCENVVTQNVVQGTCATRTDFACSSHVGPLQTPWCAKGLDIHQCENPRHRACRAPVRGSGDPPGCEDIMNDTANCGGCGVVCAEGELCEYGYCIPG